MTRGIWRVMIGLSSPRNLETTTSNSLVHMALLKPTHEKMAISPYICWKWRFSKKRDFLVIERIECEEDNLIFGSLQSLLQPESGKSDSYSKSLKSSHDLDKFSWMNWSLKYSGSFLPLHRSWFRVVVALLVKVPYSCYAQPFFLSDAQALRMLRLRCKHRDVLQFDYNAQLFYGHSRANQVLDSKSGASDRNFFRYIQFFQYHVGKILLSPHSERAI